MRPDGTVYNNATSNSIRPDSHNYGRLRLVNDEGKTKWFDPSENKPLIWPPEPEKEKPAKKKQVYVPRPKFILPEDMAERRRLHRPGKISEDQVREIRSLAEQGLFRPKDGPKKYGICSQTAGKIIGRKIYPHI